MTINRTIAQVISDTLDDTEIDHIVTKSSANELKKELTEAFKAEGYMVD